MQPHSTPAPQQGCEPANTAAEVVSTAGPRDRDVPPRGTCSVHARWAEARTSVRTRLNFDCNGKWLHRQAAVAQLLSWLCIHLHVTLVVSPLGCGLHISNHGNWTRWPVRPLELAFAIESMFGAPTPLWGAGWLRPHLQPLAPEASPSLQTFGSVPRKDSLYQGEREGVSVNTYGWELVEGWSWNDGEGPSAHSGWISWQKDSPWLHRRMLQPPFPRWEVQDWWEQFWVKSL